MKYSITTNGAEGASTTATRSTKRGAWNAAKGGMAKPGTASVSITKHSDCPYTGDDTSAIVWEANTKLGDELDAYYGMLHADEAGLRRGESGALQEEARNQAWDSRGDN